MKMMSIVAVVLSLIFGVSCSQKSKNNEVMSEKKTPTPRPDACVDSICQLHVEGYPQEVAILIPPYADFKQATLFLHSTSLGTERDHRLNAIMSDFDIVKSFKESNSNRILIIPFSTGQNRDFRKILKNKVALQVFLANVYKSIAVKVMIEDLHLIGHGEAYVTMQNILQDRSKEIQNFDISQVTLLDATYGKFKPGIFNHWMKAGAHKMTVIYLKNTPTEKKALELWSLYSGEKPGKEGGINLDGGNYITLIPEAEFAKKTNAQSLLVRKWFGRIL